MINKILPLLVPFLAFASNEPQCNYTTTEHAKYVKQQYQYKSGNINEPCIKVFTINDYYKSNVKNEIVEIPTDSSWVFTNNEECRCQDNKSPESLWNKTFPKNNYTTKDIMITLKSYADQPIESDKIVQEIDIIQKDRRIYNKKEELLVENKNGIFTNIDNRNINVSSEILKMKRMENNIFITNSKNYIKELKIKSIGKYILSFKTTEDINVLQVFNDELMKIQEFRYYDPYEIETNFLIEVTKENTTISLMGLNPYGKGSLKGIFDIKINKINLK